jgi:hypothetical protein
MTFGQIITSILIAISTLFGLIYYYHSKDYSALTISFTGSAMVAGVYGVSTLDFF